MESKPAEHKAEHKPMHFRTRLARVRGLGSAHHGVGHWWVERVTAVALIPLTLWFLAALMNTLLQPDVLKVAQWFGSPLNSLLMILLIIASFVHAKLGMEVIIEDYVHQPAPKYALLLLNSFGCWILAALALMAVLKLHFLDVVSIG